MKGKANAQPTSKTARSSMKGMKEEPFKASGDMARIIPLGGGTHAYVLDPRDGKTHHVQVGSARWVLLMSGLLEHPEHASRIRAELANLGWAHVS